VGSGVGVRSIEFMIVGNKVDVGGGVDVGYADGVIEEIDDISHTSDTSYIIIGSHSPSTIVNNSSLLETPVILHILQLISSEYTSNTPVIRKI
jgi:hypothetical protein